LFNECGQHEGSLFSKVKDWATQEWRSFAANFDFSKEGIEQNAYALMVCLTDGEGAASPY
jgi:hypothetical protein